VTRHARQLLKVKGQTITFLEFPTPICLFTIQLLLGYDDD